MGTVSSVRTAPPTGKAALASGREGPMMTRGGFEGFSQGLYIVQAWLLAGHQWGVQEGWHVNLSPQPT